VSTMPEGQHKQSAATSNTRNKHVSLTVVA
jgi:hypothetical protein